MTDDPGGGSGLTPEDVDAQSRQRALALDRRSQSRAAESRRREEVIRRRGRRNFAIIWASAVLMSLSLSLVLQHNIDAADEFSHQQCQRERTTAIRFNDGLAHLVEVEKRRPDSDGTRQARIAAYQQLALEVPACD
jgi:hypothetical protein